MSRPPQSPASQRGSGDPAHAFGYVVTGVGFYGVLGWLLDGWLGTSFLLPVGIVIGAVLGMYLLFVRFRTPDHD